MITSDLMLREHVQNELGWEPSLNSETIGVGVHDAVVTLSGHVKATRRSMRPEKLSRLYEGCGALPTNWT